MATGSTVLSIPKTKALPLVGRMRSRMVRIAVVLPAPLGPRKPKTSPCSTVRSTSMIPRCEPYDFVSLSVWMIEVNRGVLLAHHAPGGETGQDGRDDPT